MKETYLVRCHGWSCSLCPIADLLLLFTVVNHKESPKRTHHVISGGASCCTCNVCENSPLKDKTSGEWPQEFTRLAVHGCISMKNQNLRQLSVVNSHSRKWKQHVWWIEECRLMLATSGTYKSVTLENCSAAQMWLLQHTWHLAHVGWTCGWGKPARHMTQSSL